MDASRFFTGRQCATWLAVLSLCGTFHVQAAVVEYYDPDLNDYFMTVDPSEQAFVDAGKAGHWVRTGNSFESGGASPVCRFYGNAHINPATGVPYGPNSHFYTVSADECNYWVQRQNPNAFSWTLENEHAFYSTPAVNGSCAAGLVNIYRAYNLNDQNPNHRITSNIAAYQQTVTAGWRGEGIVMCAPPANAAAPTSLTYAVNPASYTTGTVIALNQPSSGGGTPSLYAISPALPTGLSLNANTGVISGTPVTPAARAIYTVTASNDVGSATASLILGVSRAIKGFAVGPDIALTYPSSGTSGGYLVNLSDEHTTVFPPGSLNNPSSYLFFAASKVSNGTSGAVVLETADLRTFTDASPLGYANQVFHSQLAINACNPLYDTAFDVNYSAPGSVLQDPARPAGNLIMLYEAENHCPGDATSQPYYATTGFARSADYGKTWPTPDNSASGNSQRYPVLKGPNPQPAAVGYGPMGDAIPAAFAERDLDGNVYVYTVYGYHPGGGTFGQGDGRLRMARAQLGSDPVVFSKWYNGAFSQAGIGGLDSGITPSAGCAGGQRMGDLSYNDGLAAYLLVFVCTWTPQGGTSQGAWYYSTATSLDLQDWSAPQEIAGSVFPSISPCSGGAGGSFDGWYPSLMSPNAAQGHTKLTGYAFFMSGCDTGARAFASRSFTITGGP